MRVIDCHCGNTLQAANDDDLFDAVRGHFDDDHSELDLEDGEVRELISEQAYEASDA